MCIPQSQVSLRSSGDTQLRHGMTPSDPLNRASVLFTLAVAQNRSFAKEVGPRFRSSGMSPFFDLEDGQKGTTTQRGPYHTSKLGILE